MQTQSTIHGKKDSRSSRFWRNIAIAIGLTLLAGVLVVAAYIVATSARLAADALTPPRVPLDRTPLDVGITEYENVAFTASDGVVLRGWYIPSKNGAAIIMAHGYAGNRLMLLPEAQILAAQGYGVLLFDFRGHGESADALVTLGDREQRDVNAAVDFVAAQPGVVKIGAIGFSMGATTLAQVATRDERLDAVVVQAAFATLAAEIRHRSRTFGPLSQIPSLRAIRRAGVDVDGVRPVDGLCTISPRPLLLIYGELDAAVPPGTAQAMLDAACEASELWVIEGAGHGEYIQVTPEQYAARLLNFFDW